MTLSPIRSLLFGGMAAAIVAALPAGAAIVPAGGTAVTAAAKAGKVQLARVECMIDDGFGRFHPCSQGYKKEHPDWRTGDTCMIDDGQGRAHPCSAMYKKRHSQ